MLRKWQGFPHLPTRGGVRARTGLWVGQGGKQEAEGSQPCLDQVKVSDSDSESSFYPKNACMQLHIHTHEGARACTPAAHILSQGIIRPTSRSSPDRQPMGTLTSQSSCKRMSLTLTPLPGLICPNSHLTRTGKGSFIMDGVCTLPRPPEASAKLFAVTLS